MASQPKEILMARVITIAQQKGGAGKTSLAVHLAIAWAGYGAHRKGEARRPSNDVNKNCAAADARTIRRVTVLDMDPQESLAEWYRVRQRRAPDETGFKVVAASGWRGAGALTGARLESDLIVIDTPPHADSLVVRNAIRAADLVIVPTQLSPMDIWATQATLELIAKEKKPSVMVLNRVPPRARLADELVEQLREHKLPLANAAIGNRILFASSLMEGKGVTEAQPGSVAAAEIRLLAGEVLRKVA